MKKPLFMIHYLACFHTLFFRKKEIRDILGILPFRQRLCFFFNVALHPVITLSWLEYILSEPHCFCPCLRTLHRRLQKPLNPYLNRTLTIEDRLKHLHEHFDFLKQFFRADHSNFMALKNSGLRLAIFSSPNQKSYEMVLAETHHFDRTGEFHLTLRETETHKRIAEAAFNLGITPKRRMYIGHMHGHDSGGVEFIRLITHDLCGIRPKNLLIFALYDLAEVWNIRSIRAIDNTRRISAHGKGIIKYGKAIQTDYELLWKELGGRYTGRGWFKLPHRLKQKSANGVRSKHRAEHSRKIELREDIRSQIHTLFLS